MKRRLVLGAAAGALISRPGYSQSFPDRPVRFVIPFAPGGSSDVGARALGERLEKILGQTVVVDNKPGGATVLATEFVAKSKPDGYTYLQATGALTINDAFGLQLPYDAFKDLVPVAHFFNVPVIVAVSPDAPWKTMAELLADAKQKGAPIPYACAALGSMQNLWAEELRARLGLRFEQVGYKGSSEALRDVMAGHVKLLIDLMVPTGAAVKSGKLRGLVVAMPQRAPLVPDVPTVGEVGQGLEGTECAVFNGYVTPAGTPQAAIARLNGAINQVFADTEFRKRLEDMGLALIGGSPESFGKTLLAEREKWRKVIKDLNIPKPS